MKVILLTDVPKIGHKYDVKDVAAGYATNFLIPKKLAETATPKKIKNLELKVAEIDEEKKIQKVLLDKNFEALNTVSVEIKEKANDKGHLFKGLHAEEILQALRKQAHIDLPPESIQLEQPIKEVGEHTISVVVGEKTAAFKLVVIKKEDHPKD